MKYIIVILVCFSSAHLKASQVDRTLKSIEHLSDSAQVDSLVKIARSFVIQEDGKSALPFAKLAYKKALAKNYRDLIPKSNFYLAASFMESQQYDSATIHYEQALEQMQGTALEDWAKHVYINLPFICQNTGDYKKALQYQLEAIKYAEEIKDTAMMAHYMTEVGYSHDRMRAFDEAIKWHRKSLKLLKQLGDDGYYYYVLSRVGMAFDDMANYDSAFHYNFKALRYFEQNSDSSEVADISSNIGNTYYKQQNWEKALFYTLRAYNIKKTDEHHSSLSITQSNLGLIYTQLKKYDDAEYHIRSSIKSAKQVQHKKALSEGYDGLYQLYLAKHNLDSALHYFKLMDQLEDSIYQLERTEQMAEMQTRYETTKKEQQIALQKAELSEKESKLLARQRFIMLMALLIVALIIFGYLFYQRYKSKKEQELQKALIKEQKKGLNAVLEAQEEERKRISKDLHDGVGQQLSGLKMAFQKLTQSIQAKNPEQGDELEKLNEILNDSADEVRSISHQMMPKALTELGLKEAIQDMLEKSLGNSDIEYEFEHFGVKDRFREKVEVSLYRICQELVNNIIKHSKATKVAVQLFKNKDKLILIVEDNGVGIKKGEGSDGHGLLNIKSRLNPLSGGVNFEPSPHSGTIATIRIPL